MKAKFKENDTVRFTMTLFKHPQELIGQVYIVDEYGTWEQNEEPSYDIMVDEVGLIKHIRESALTAY